MNELQEKLTVMIVVAVALIRADGRVLMQRRRFGTVHGGLWEFPGGKVEPKETVQYAAVREIAEELGVAIDPAELEPAGFAATSGEAGGTVSHQIVILLYICRRWSGEPQCRDAEEIGWFEPDAIPGLEMPPLDYPLAQGLIRCLARGSGGIAG